MDISSASQIIEAAIPVYRFFKKKKQEQPLHQLARRFIRIFAAQGIEAIQVPSALYPEFDLGPCDFATTDTLLSKLSAKLLRHAINVSGIDSEWLDGNSECVYSCFPAYHNLHACIRLFAQLRAQNREIELHVVKGSFNDLERCSNARLAIFIRSAPENEVTLKVWHEYHFGDGWRWDYGGTRLELKALCLIAWQFTPNICCHSAPQRKIDKFANGQLFCGELLNSAHTQTWHLDDYIFSKKESCCAADENEALEVRRYLQRENLMSALLAAAGREKLRLVRM